MGLYLRSKDRVMLKTYNGPNGIFAYRGGGGATRPLPRDGGVEELHGDLTVGPRAKVWTRDQKWKK